MMLIKRVKYLTWLNLRTLIVCRNNLSLSTVIKEDQIRVDNYDINYLKVGNGSNNVLCVPGTFGTIWTDFRPQVEGFDREKFTLIAYDPPGYGKSRPPNKQFTGNFYEEDAYFLHKLAKALNLSKYSLVGWSGGGIISIIHAAKYPNAVEKLVTWGAISFILPQELDVYKDIKDLNNWSGSMKQLMIDIYGEHFKDYCKTWIEGMRALYKDNNGNVCSELLKDIQCPTLILSGGKDPMIHSIHAQYLHAQIKGSRLHSYPEGKHNIHIKYSEDFNRRVQNFLLEQ